jgi:predicted esterase
MMNRWPNKVTGANAGGPRQLRIRTRWAARVAQFCRYAAHLSQSRMQSMTTTARFPIATLLLLLAVAAATLSCRPSHRAPEGVAAKHDDGVTVGDSRVDKQSTSTNSVVILNGGGAKPRILALHGGGEDSASFSRQQGVRDLAAALPHYEFVFANAPEPGGVWLRDPPSKKQPTTDPNWANGSIEYLDRFVAEHGPFYGLIAYSQGAPMAVIYLAQRPTNTFQRVALFNGYEESLHQGLMATIDRAAPFAVRTLVFSGAHDPFARLTGLASRFTSPLEIQSSTAGHHLPYSSDATFSRVVSFLNAE